MAMIFENLEVGTLFVIHDTWERVQLQAGATYRKVAKWHAREVVCIDGRWQLRQGTTNVRISGGHPVELKQA
jgi:hypothetical protein